LSFPKNVERRKIEIFSPIRKEKEVGGKKKKKMVHPLKNKNISLFIHFKEIGGWEACDKV
jgi:hypothetical protein